MSWTLSVPPGNETACIVQALDEDFTVVGWKVVEIPASEQHLRTFTETRAGRPRGEHGFDFALLAHLIWGIRPGRRRGVTSICRSAPWRRTPPSPGSRRRRYDRLAAELEELSTHGREEIAKRIESAREEGDLKENGGYHAAKDEQGKHGGPHPPAHRAAAHRPGRRGAPAPGVVEPGTVITAIIAGDEETFLIGSREIAGDSELDVYSEQSPLGAAIIGLKVGEKTTYTAPNGREIAVEVTGVETWGGQ